MSRIQGLNIQGQGLSIPDKAIATALFPAQSRQGNLVKTIYIRYLICSSGLQNDYPAFRLVKPHGTGGIFGQARRQRQIRQSGKIPRSCCKGREGKQDQQGKKITHELILRGDNGNTSQIPPSPQRGEGIFLV